MFKAISFYKYIEIKNTESLKEEIRNKCHELKIFGRILMGNEGINAAVSGKEESIGNFKEFLISKKEFLNLTFREQKSNKLAHHKLIVRTRKEIVNFGHKINIENKGKHISPKELKEMLNKKEEIILLDARNNYETEAGKFRNALTLPIETFREFPKAMENLNLKNKKIVMYCTGGIRCEKASAYLKENGYNNVFQLEGGIINYVNQFPNDFFEGSCFVFDDRILPDEENAILKNCDICKNKSIYYLNCYNIDCDKLFFSCKNCREKLNNNCSEECMNALRHRKKEKNYRIIAKVENYYRKNKVILAKIEDGEINVNDKIIIIGKEKNEIQEIKELRDFNGNNIDSAFSGSIVTFPVSFIVKRNSLIAAYGK